MFGFISRSRASKKINKGLEAKTKRLNEQYAYLNKMTPEERAEHARKNSEKIKEVREKRVANVRKHRGHEA